MSKIFLFNIINLKKIYEGALENTIFFVCQKKNFGCHTCEHTTYISPWFSRCNVYTWSDYRSRYLVDSHWEYKMNRKMQSFESKWHVDWKTWIWLSELSLWLCLATISSSWINVAQNFWGVRPGGLTKFKSRHAVNRQIHPLYVPEFQCFYCQNSSDFCN